MVDFLQSVDSDNGKREPTPVTLVSNGVELALGLTPSARSNLATGQVSVATTATMIVAARTGRDSVLVINGGATDVWLGGSGVTTANGLLLSGVKGASISLPFSGALYGITATVAEPVSFVDIY